MRIKLLIILFCVPFLSFSEEEKRLALVIGNSNYNKGELKNPVNDALLIAETLKQLEFDVILDTNLSDKRSFKETIRSFGNRRPNYDVAFVYYAGHGIQVGSENYLLPTKEVFESEYDVQDYGVSVQDIMRYLTGMSDQVNVLILDACRDNPFEVKWNATRSLKGGGLAKIPPPTGSLIAFSTDAGNTAADGDGKNSVYCKSLCKYMLLENTSLDQVFRNVRSDVLKITNKQQRPVESSQLTGEAFFLVKSTYDYQFNKIDSIYNLIINANYNEEFDSDIEDLLWYKALEIANQIIALDNNNKRAYLKRSMIYEELKKYDLSLDDINFSLKIDSNYVDGLYSRSGLYTNYLDKRDLGIRDLKKVIDLDPQNIGAYYTNIVLLFQDNQFQEAVDMCTKASLVYPDDEEFYRQKGNMLTELGQFELAMQAYDKSIELTPENGFMYVNKGSGLYIFGKYKKALSCFKKANKLKPDEPSPYYDMISCYVKLNSLDSLPFLCKKWMEISPSSPGPYFYYYYYYKQNNDIPKAISYISMSIYKMLEEIEEGWDPYVMDYISEGSESQWFELKDIYLKRANLYKSLNIDILSCPDFKSACDLGNCELFNSNCK